MATLTNKFAFFLAIIIVANSCPRHRKPWHRISDDERQLYIDGMLQLSDMGILQKFTEQHLDNPTLQAHDNNMFLPWHRYYIWELESQIRDLGGQFECFSLPYWYAYVIRYTSTI